MVSKIPKDFPDSLKTKFRFSLRLKRSSLLRFFFGGGNGGEMGEEDGVETGIGGLLSAPELLASTCVLLISDVPESA